MKLSEKSTGIQDKFLCMLHDYINKELFEDKLQHIFCCFTEISDISVNGCYYANNDDLGARIEISRKYLEYIDQFFEEDRSYMLFIVLLHEMIHQYCDENGIQSSAHDKTFCDTAAKFGLETYSKDGNVIDKERLLQKALEVVPADMFEHIDEKAAEFDTLY